MNSMPEPPGRTRRHIQGGLLVLAVMYTLYFTHDLVLPILVAALLALLLSPVVAQMHRLRAPRALAAGLVVVLFVGGLGWGLYGLAGPARDWLDRSPQLFGQIERKLRPVRQPVEEVRQATEHVKQLAGDGKPTVKVDRFDPGGVVVVSATKLVTQAAIVVFLVYFLLSSGDPMMRRLIGAARTPEARHRAVLVARAVKHDVTTYLGLVTMVNTGLGVATGLAGWALGLPNPALWGVLATVLNFMPYAGPGIMLCVLAVVGVLTFDGLGHGLAPAGVFLIFTNIEGNLITPTLVGHRLTLPPLMVFLSLVVWSWMWGVAGALLATPILVVMKVVLEHAEGPGLLAQLLGVRPRLPCGGNGLRLRDRQ
ncbi:MAG: AI-2E family transporter [Actinomycetota bacterium]